LTVIKELTMPINICNIDSDKDVGISNIGV